MAHGPGKYDDIVTKVREETKAEGVVLIVLGGSRGNGFSVQAPPRLLIDLPRMLTGVAETIIEDLSNDIESVIAKGMADSPQT